jgi:alpha-ketoglutarate-dependent taurine dioxygenase
MIYDVQDTGKKADAGSGIRPDKTNIDLTFHNDNAYNACMPEVVGLLCLKTARSGGRSRVMSFQTAYAALAERAPEVLPRLYRPFWFDRQREHRPDEPETFAAPVFVDAHGEVQARLGLHQVRNAYLMRGEDLDAEGQAALAALEAVFGERDLQFDFAMEPGQVQYVDNLAIGHSRTQFEDFQEPERRRHLVRLWMRDSGDRSYPG